MDNRRKHSYTRKARPVTALGDASATMPRERSADRELFANHPSFKKQRDKIRRYSQNNVLVQQNKNSAQAKALRELGSIISNNSSFVKRNAYSRQAAANGHRSLQTIQNKENVNLNGTHNLDLGSIITPKFAAISAHKHTAFAFPQNDQKDSQPC